MKYDLSKPPKQRVVSLSLLCTDCRVPKYEPLDPEKIYTVVMPSYIVDGGDGFDMIKNELLKHNTGRKFGSEEVAVANHALKIKWIAFSHVFIMLVIVVSTFSYDVLQLKRLIEFLVSRQEYQERGNPQKKKKKLTLTQLILTATQVYFSLRPLRQTYFPEFLWTL